MRFRSHLTSLSTEAGTTHAAGFQLKLSQSSTNRLLRTPTSPALSIIYQSPLTQAGCSCQVLVFCAQTIGDNPVTRNQEPGNIQSIRNFFTHCKMVTNRKLWRSENDGHGWSRQTRVYTASYGLMGIRLSLSNIIDIPTSRRVGQV